MQALAAVDAVLLDMDGTLVDSDGAVERAWIGWCDEYGIDPATVLPHIHGQPAATTIGQLCPHWSPAQVRQAAARQHALQYDDLSDVVATTGTDALLAVLTRRRLPWAVVTSADGRLARARLAAAGIAPPHLFTIDDVREGKPHPEGYLLAADRLGVPPHRCLVVEDSPPGIEAGRRAGAMTASLRGLPADLPLADLADLAALLTGTHLPVAPAG